MTCKNSNEKFLLIIFNIIWFENYQFLIDISDFNGHFQIIMIISFKQNNKLFPVVFTTAIEYDSLINFCSDFMHLMHRKLYRNFSCFKLNFNEK